MATHAKPGLLKARALLLQHLRIAPASVGIVGDPAHIGGYHCGSGRLYTVAGQVRDYSVTEAARDARGLRAHPDWASALDIGVFTATVKGRTHNLRSFSTWLVALCKAGDPDAADIREVIYSPDGRTVRRWDRLARRTGGDDSHLWHTHISEHRDADGSRMVRLVNRYLTHIGLIEGEDDDMQLTDLVYTDTTGKKRTVGSILGTLDVIVRRHEQASIAAFKQVLTAVADDDTPVTIPAEQIPVLAAQLAAAMPTAASIADAVNDDAAARLGQ